MKKRSLYIIVAVAVIAVFALGISSLTGRTTIGNCIDSDSGDDPLTPGSVSFTESSAVYKDKCYATGGLGSKVYVKERICLGKLEFEKYKCAAGCTENANGEGYCLPGEVNKIEN